MMSLADTTMMLMSTINLKSTKNNAEETVQLTNDEITMPKTMISIGMTRIMRRRGERLPAVGEATAAIMMRMSTGMSQKGVYLNTMAPVDTIIAPEEMEEAETIKQIQPQIWITTIMTNNEVDTNLTQRAIITMVMRNMMQLQIATASEAAPVTEHVVVATAEVVTHHTLPLPINKTMRAAVVVVTTGAESMQQRTRSTVRNSISSSANSIRIQLLCSNNSLATATNQVINRKDEPTSTQTTATSITKRKIMMTRSAVEGISTTMRRKTTEATQMM